MQIFHIWNTLTYVCANDPFKLFLQIPSMSRRHKMSRQTALGSHMGHVDPTSAGVLCS